MDKYPLQPLWSQGRAANKNMYLFEYSLSGRKPKNYSNEVNKKHNKNFQFVEFA